MTVKRARMFAIVAVLALSLLPSDMSNADEICGTFTGNSGACESSQDSPLLPPPPEASNSASGGHAVVPFWLWYRAYCGTGTRVVCDTQGVTVEGPSVCEKDGQPGIYMALWREDFEPRIPPREVTGMFCVPDITALTTPARPDPVVHLNDIDFYHLTKPPILINPSPNTLIRYPTSIRTIGAEQTSTLTLLGKTILVTVHPIAYHWNYGDGTTLTSTHPGKRFTPNPISLDPPPAGAGHVYHNTGTYQISLTTDYTATYSVEGKPAKPVQGTGHITSTTETLDVWRTQTGNVADTCTQNPHSWGCPHH